MKFGIIYCGYNSVEYVNDSLRNFIDRPDIIISAVSVPFQEYQLQPDYDDGTTDLLREYVFDSRKVLKPGKYVIENCLKPGKNVLLMIEGCLYYGQEKFVEELKTAKEQTLIIEERESNKGQKYVVSYIAGFPPKSPSQKIKDFIQTLGIEIDKEKYEAKKFCKFEPEIVLTVLGIENSEYVWEGKTIKQKLVTGKVGDKKYTVQANSPIVNAINDGRLMPKDGENYEDGQFKIIFLGVQQGSKGAEFKVSIEAPVNEESKNSMLALLE
jgi:hypothetical protein